MGQRRRARRVFTLRGLARAVGLLVTFGACGDGEQALVPPGAYCDEAADLTGGDFEDEVLGLVNARRAAGATCGTEAWPAVGALTMEPALRCAARVHSLDMARRGYFDHISPEGEGPAQRVERAGYGWRAVGENIAAGYPDAGAVVQGWMSSLGHCRNIMNGRYVHTGVGYVADGMLWTQVFAAPR